MRDSPDAVAAGGLSPAAVEARLAGYVAGEAGRFHVTCARCSGAVQRPGCVPNSVGTHDMTCGGV
jgi:hypothetical protein